MTHETNALMAMDATACRQTIEAFYSAVARGDLAAVSSAFAENAMVSLAGQLEMCGSYQGRDRLLEWAAAVFARLDPTETEAHSQYSIFAVEPPRVCAVSQTRARALDGFEYHPTYVHLFDIDGGLIVRFWEFADTAMLEQLFGNRLERPQAGAGAPFELW